MASVSIETALFKGNVAVHTSDDPLINGDGSIEVEGTAYIGKLLPYITDGTISINNSSFDTNGSTLKNLTATGSVNIPNTPLSTLSGGTGLNNIAANRILFGGNPLQTSALFTYDPVGANVSAPNVTVSQNGNINTLSLINPLSVNSGGTGRQSLTDKSILYGTGTTSVGLSTAFTFDSSVGALSAPSIRTTGNVTCSNPTLPTHAATRGYVDDMTYLLAGTGLTKTNVNSINTLTVNANLPHLKSVGTLTLPTASPTDVNIYMAANTAGTIYFTPIPARTFSDNVEFTTSGIKHYYANGTTTNGKVTFNVTSNGTATGTAFFTRLLCYPIATTMQTAAANSALDVAYASINSVSADLKTVVVNVCQGRGILLGGSSFQYIANGTPVSIFMCGV